MNKNHKDIITLILIFLFAFILRIVYLFSLKNHYFFYDHPSADVTYYHEWAEEIASGNWLGQRTFYGFPLYPYFLAVLKSITLFNPLLLRLFHILLGSINCCLIYIIAKQIFSERVGLLSAILAAGNFILIYYDWLMMPVTLIIFLSLIIILSLMNLDNCKKSSEYCILGILLGLVIVGDGKFLIFFALMGLYVILSYRGWIPILQRLLPISLGVFLIVFSVALRNKIVGGDWVMITAQSGLSFYAGNNKNAAGLYENPEFIRPTHEGQDEDQAIIAQLLSNRSLSAGEISHFWQNKALTFIRSDPGKFLKLLGKKFILFFTEHERAHDIDMILQREWRQKFDFNSYSVICPLALLGMFLSWRHKKHTAFLNLLILSQLVITLLFFLTARHRTSIYPFFIIFEAYFFVWFFDQARRRQFKTIALSMGFVVIFLNLFPPQPVDSKTVAFLTHTKAGPIFEKQKLYEKAREHYIEALRLRPHDTNALYNLGNTFLLEGNLEMAEEQYLRAIQTCHYNVDALFNLGYVYEHQNDNDQALQMYNQVLQYQPTSSDAYYRIANIYANQGNCQAARQYYTEIIKHKPQLRAQIHKAMTACSNP